MSQADLVQDLQGILQDAAEKFTAPGGADFVRHLDLAARDLARFRPRTLLGTVKLVADEPAYNAPADLVRPKVALWGMTERARRRPWQRNFPQRLPTMLAIEGVAGMELHLSPPPTAEQIADLGVDFKFYYFAAHRVDPDPAKTTVHPGDRHLLLVRATAQAMQELAHDGSSKPVKLGSGGVGSMPKNGTPGALAESLMALFEKMAA